jgi:hypothetical protein
MNQPPIPRDDLHASFARAQLRLLDECTAIIANTNAALCHEETRADAIESIDRMLRAARVLKGGAS